MESVLKSVVHCQDNSIIFSGEGNYSGVGRKSIIKIESVEAEVIADAVENGNSLKMTTFIVNQYHKASEYSSVTYSAVRGCFLKLCPQIKPTRRGK